MAFVRSILAALVLAAVVMGAGPGWALEAVGEVLRVKGAATVTRGEATEPLMVGAALGRTDVVKTGAGGRAQIRLADGSVLTLTENASYRVVEFEHDPATQKRAVRIAPLAGRIQATVAKAAPGSKFEVELAFSVASVRGTDFMWDMASDGCIIFVREGLVAVKHKQPEFHDRVILMRDWDGVTVRPGEPPAYAAQWSRDLGQLWIDGMRFE